jgi:hypothetical protein
MLGLNYQFGKIPKLGWDVGPKKTSTPIWKAISVSKISKLGTSRLLLRVPTTLKKLNYYTRNPTKSRDFTTKLARNRLFAHRNTIKLAPSGALQRFSEAASNILTPKTAKLPQIPASTDSNSQPTTSTHFSTTNKILPKKNLPSRNSNPQPPNLPQNLSLPHNQDNEIFHPTPTK